MAFNKEKFLQAIKEIAKDNLIEVKELNDIIRKSFFKTFHSKIDPDAKLELIIDNEEGIFEFINHSKIVVDDSGFDEQYSSIDISLSKAKKIKKDVKIDDAISEEIDLSLHKKFSQQVKQLIIQSVRERKKEEVFARHKSLKDEMITAEVTSSTKGHVVFKLDDGTSAFMPANLRNLNIPLKMGEMIKVFVEDVLEESKDSQIIVSNGSPTILRRMLENEIPEIQDGSVEIVKISRIAGLRSKIAVRSYQENIDSVGAIIGAGGSRIKNILSKLEKEKIDIIKWSPIENEFISNALSPAKVISVLSKYNSDDEEIENHKIIVTPNIHQTLAIGKMGSNAKLAVELVSKRLDIISIDKAKEMGLKIEWNGNINQSELEMVESGIRLQNNRPRKTESMQNMILGDIDKDISIFSDDISNTSRKIYEEEKEEETSKEDYSFDYDMFSEDEIKNLEDSFEFDEELMAFGTEKHKSEEE